ncbi:MAG: hypothetical protein B0W54_12810 [Cellvibrio sp. 79]|nr:MAG: hypothetical protein B0W54_12810 [Cellvibrio sp. 79]
MIETLSDFLKKLIEVEKAKLAEFKEIHGTTHGPTIGKMYEGLTADVLSKTFPPGTDLQVVSGFIHDGRGNQSGEIDCMLVIGSGKKIPYTDMYLWHVKDVLAIVEVKKNLYEQGISDSFEHLRDAGKTFHSYIQNFEVGENFFNISPARRAFQEITGVSPDELPNHIGNTLEYLYHTLVNEQLAPVRIVIGYNGYKSERSLRESFFNYLCSKEMTRGFGIGSFPQLVVCENYSLVKLNGQPFSSMMQDENWCFYASSNENPLTLLIEIIWTKITNTLDSSMPWGDDLIDQNLAQFLAGKIVQKDDVVGWAYECFDIPAEFLKERAPNKAWEPLFVDAHTFTMINVLCNTGEINTKDEAFTTYLTENNLNSVDFIRSLQGTGFVIRNGNKLELCTYECKCVCLPDGRFAVAEDNSGRLTRWIEKVCLGQLNSIRP